MPALGRASFIVGYHRARPITGEACCHVWRIDLRIAPGRRGTTQGEVALIDATGRAIFAVCGNDAPTSVRRSSAA